MRAPCGAGHRKSRGPGPAHGSWWSLLGGFVPPLTPTRWAGASRHRRLRGPSSGEGRRCDRAYSVALLSRLQWRAERRRLRSLRADRPGCQRGQASMPTSSFVHADGSAGGRLGDFLPFFHVANTRRVIGPVWAVRPGPGQEATHESSTIWVRRGGGVIECPAERSLVENRAGNCRAGIGVDAMPSGTSFRSGEVGLHELGGSRGRA